MYEVKLNKEAKKHVIIVEGVNDLTTIDHLLTKEFDEFKVTGLAHKNYIAIFELHENPGTAFYYHFKVISEDVDEKTVTEYYLQEAKDIDIAKKLLLDNIDYTPEVVEAKLTKIEKILR